MRTQFEDEEINFGGESDYNKENDYSEESDYKEEFDYSEGFDDSEKTDDRQKTDYSDDADYEEEFQYEDGIDEIEDEEEKQRRERWEKKIAEMRQQKARQKRLHRIVKRLAFCGGGILCAVIFFWVGIHLSHKSVEAKGTEGTENSQGIAGKEESGTGTAGIEESGPEASETAGVGELGQAASGTGSLEGETAEGRVVGAKPAGDAGADHVEKEGSVSDEGNTQDLSENGLQEANTPENAAEDGTIRVGDAAFWIGYSADATPTTVAVGDEDVLSAHAILIDAGSGMIVAQKDAKSIMNPASMTKILTVLVAAEHVTDLDDEFTITLEITDYAYVHGCSTAGFLDDETVTVRDLFYGTVLPSGGEAAVALATYVAGSQEAFVEMMNEKLDELGLSQTAHFTNCVGIYDENHKCTTYDMAMILKAAVENDWCREVLSAHTYTTSATEQHPEGIVISNWFLRRIEDKDCGGEVLCAKTGFVNQSGSCAASYEISASGTPYICVTADTYSSWRCIYDHVAMYSLYGQ